MLYRRNIYESSSALNNRTLLMYDHFFFFNFRRILFEKRFELDIDLVSKRRIGNISHSPIFQWLHCGKIGRKIFIAQQTSFRLSDINSLPL